MKYRLGTRRSSLAQIQANGIREQLESTGIYCELVIIESEGDAKRFQPLYELEPESPGLFTKQLEDALLADEIDLAVHSLKDLPTIQPDPLVVAAVPQRANASDSLLIHEEVFELGQPLHLRKGARLGTSSLRREALFLSQRPDLEVSPLRGNIPTRVRFLQDRVFDAIVLASAGLDRLRPEMKGVRRMELPMNEFVPAPGQGALAVEVRRNSDKRLLEGLAILHDELSATETRIERAILKGLLGGCTLPLGVKCRADANGFSCRAFVGVAEDRKTNKHVWKSFHHFDISDAAEQTLVSKAIQLLGGALNG